MSDAREEMNDAVDALPIRCPSCGQRFRVGTELLARMVECGACEYRFKIDEDVIMRVKKFYPGEHTKTEDINRFQRVPLAVPTTTMGRAVEYAGNPDPDLIAPATPGRILAGLLGGGLMCLTALLLIFGASTNGALDGMPTINRLVLAVFISALGIGLLIYANRKARLKAAFFGLLMAAGVTSLPLFFTAGSEPLLAVENPNAEAIADSEEPSVDAKLLALREILGTEPLESEIKRLSRVMPEASAYGVWLKGMRESNRLLVRDYLMRATDADPTSHMYPRDNGDYLFVLTGLRLRPEELGMILGALGTVGEIHEVLPVLEVEVDNGAFDEVPIEKLSDPTDPGFYELNRAELNSIDLKRVERAAQRLAEVEPRLYRTDIARRLIRLMGEEEVDFHAAICRAMLVWAMDEPGTVEAVSTTMVRLHSAGREIPREMVSLLSLAKETSVLPIVHELWKSEPSKWEEPYGQFGPEIEAKVLEVFPETEGGLRLSAIRLLGDVGGRDSIRVLESARDGAVTEAKVLIDRAVARIGERLSG